jgi:8-oxo-dGTP diphosphatase
MTESILPDQSIRHFNIRVYGLLLNEKKEVLISDEYVLDRYMSKFPGGGMKFGEGPEDCIKREAMEELGQEIEIKEHFYTTGFFQRALFYSDHQLISIYYLISLSGEPLFHISTRAFDFKAKINGSQSFRWVAVSDLKEEDLTFPVDRYVLGLLKKSVNT